MAQTRSYAKKRKGTTYLKRFAKYLHPRVGEEYQATLPSLHSPSYPYGINRKGSVNPKSSLAKWTASEVVSFIVALYLFGKNFSLVKIFLCERNIGDIQSFYYGKFYNTKKYRRWANYRKSAGGEKPLTEIGTKRIFLRLHPQVPQGYREAAKKAHEVCKDTSSLMYYALIMKKAVGPEALLKGIKHELTYLDVDEEQTSAKKKNKSCKHVKRVADPPTLHVKRRKLTKLESKPIKDENADQEIKKESNDLVSESSNGRRQSQRRRVMSTKAVEAFETSAKKKSKSCKHAKRVADPPTLPVKRQKLTKLESKLIKDENADQEIKKESNDLVSEGSNGRRQSRRRRVMSTKAVEAFETCCIGI